MPSRLNRLVTLTLVWTATLPWGCDGCSEGREHVVLPPGVSIAVPVGSEEERCFSTGSTQTTAAQHMLLERGLQGGGATWNDLMPGVFDACGVAVGDWADASIETLGVPRVARFGDGSTPSAWIWTWVATDDSAEELIFCSGHATVTHAVRTEFIRLNGDLGALRALLDRMDPE